MTIGPTVAQKRGGYISQVSHLCVMRFSGSRDCEKARKSHRGDPLRAAFDVDAVAVPALKLLGRAQADAPPATPYYVKHGLDYMHGHPDQAITMETLVEHSGVSTRPNYAGFQRFQGVTPMAYLKSERLRRAHAKLQAADPA